MGRSRPLTRRAAVALIAGGAVLGAQQTFGISSISGNRLTDVSVADDDAAMLSISGQTAEETPVFTNRANVAMDIALTSDEDSAEFDIDGTGNYEEEANFELTGGESREVEINAEAEEILVHVSGTFGGGSISLDRWFEIPQAGQIDVTASVEATGGSGQFSFGLWNEGSLDAEMVSIRVDDTTTDAVEVANGDIFFIEESDNPNEEPRQLISTDLDIDDSQPLSPFEGEDSVILNQGADEIIFTFDRFQNPPGPGNPNTDMRGETVNISIGFSDGSVGAYELAD